MPPSSPIEQVAQSLRHDRSVDNAKIKRVLSYRFTFPSYREGFAACLTSEKLSRRG
jgi:hypothetical protein